jgi:hypothetical protein
MASSDPNQISKRDGCLKEEEEVDYESSSDVEQLDLDGNDSFFGSPDLVRLSGTMKTDVMTRSLARLTKRGNLMRLTC